MIFLIPFFTLKFHDTSVTRSLIGGNARIGSTVTGWFKSSVFSRVMHISLRPAVDLRRARAALPALQFQRTAMSLACSACTRWTASSTTIPSETSVR